MVRARARRLVEEAIGLDGTGGPWFEAACSTSSRAFGALEHLGDAVGDLAVGLSCWRAGLRATDAARLVTNDRLDAVYHRDLEGLVRARSGDVVEALVGAIHLERGFEQAARIAVGLCAAHLDWEPLGDERVGAIAGWHDATVPAWIGSLTVDAIIANAAITVIGPECTSQRELNAIRIRSTATDKLAAVARRVGALGPVDDRRAVLLLRCAVGATLVRGGWEHTVRVVAPLLVPELHPSPPRD